MLRFIAKRRHHDVESTRAAALMNDFRRLSLDAGSKEHGERCSQNGHRPATVTWPFCKQET
jgi:hypothetical protein